MHSMNNGAFVLMAAGLHDVAKVGYTHTKVNSGLLCGCNIFSNQIFGSICLQHTKSFVSLFFTGIKCWWWSCGQKETAKTRQTIINAHPRFERIFLSRLEQSLKNYPATRRMTFSNLQAISSYQVFADIHPAWKILSIVENRIISVTNTDQGKNRDKPLHYWHWGLSKKNFFNNGWWKSVFTHFWDNSANSIFERVRQKLTSYA